MAVTLNPQMAFKGKQTKSKTGKHAAIAAGTGAVIGGGITTVITKLIHSGLKNEEILEKVPAILKELNIQANFFKATSKSKIANSIVDGTVNTLTTIYKGKYPKKFIAKSAAIGAVATTTLYFVGHFIKKGINHLRHK